MWKGHYWPLCFAIAVLTAVPAFAQTSQITEDLPDFSLSLNGQTLKIDRSGAACPPRCVQPMMVAPGVGTVGELEVLEFLEIFVGDGQGLLVDARMPDVYAAATLPGAVNLPAQTLRADNPYRDDLLTALGVRNGDHAGAFDLMFFGAGADDQDAPNALRSLLETGYPATKLKYYRGGMDNWRALGLTVAGKL
ncbi:MAG: sulfurtransferase [Mameliella sp.]|nr:sulfurtransferase [Mameliella sp.]|tara:strand:+ start:3393 stop:3971 length:579 start_codon:yes stop_codon:yes gene_type:complete